MVQLPRLIILVAKEKMLYFNCLTYRIIWLSVMCVENTGCVKKQNYAVGSFEILGWEFGVVWQLVDGRYFSVTASVSGECSHLPAEVVSSMLIPIVPSAKTRKLLWYFLLTIILPRMHSVPPRTFNVLSK
jgi:hypothetical protein